jgi:hypothetical protein
MATATLFPQPERSRGEEHTRSLLLVSRGSFSVQVRTLEAEVASLSGTDLSELDTAGNLLQAVLSLKSEVIGRHAEAKKQAYEAHQSACRDEHADLDPVVALEQKVKRLLAALETKRRQANEAAGRAEREFAERAAAEMQEQLIEAAEKSGASEADIARLCQVPLSVPLPASTVTAAQPKGISASEKFLVEVTDLKALARAVAGGQAPAEVIQPNLSVLKAMAKALKGNLHLPGVSIQRDLSISGRKRQ